MPLGTEELTALRDDLVRARARGARVVQMGDERIEYRSDAEMAAALASIDRQLAGAPRPGAVRFTTSKGV